MPTFGAEIGVCLLRKKHNNTTAKRSHINSNLTVTEGPSAVQNKHEKTVKQPPKSLKNTARKSVMIIKHE